MKTLSEIIKESFETTCQEECEQLSEAYVANSKQYTQMSDNVTQKTKDLHEILYKHHVEVLNKVSAELDGADKPESNGSSSEFRSLKLDEIHNMNAVYLHELYFANCFSPMSQIYMDSLAFMRLQSVWGSFEAWQTDLIATAMATRQGWAVTAYSMYLKRFVNIIIDGNDQNVLVGMYPVLVIDCHEHAYQRDYKSDKKSYIVNMMREINWEIVEERVKRADKINEALK